MADRVLLIEDDPRLAEMISEYLGEAGFHVDRAANGSEGLTRQEREPFDVLILDLMLPDMDGLDVCRAVRMKSEIPILMLTARGDAMDRVVGLELGADDYLPKPLNRGNCWRASPRSCAAVRLPRPVMCCISAASTSTVVHMRFALTVNTGLSPAINLH